MKKIFRRLKNKKGFTLIELIVVIAIVAILAAVGIPALAGQTAKSVQSTVDANARIIAIQGDMMIVEASTTVDNETPGGNPIVEKIGKDQSDALVAEIVETAGVKLDSGDSCKITISKVYDNRNPTEVVGYNITKVEFTRGSTTGIFTRVS